MVSMRVSAQPTFPSRVRTSVQSSNVGGGAAGAERAPGRSRRRGLDSSTQFGGGRGGAGLGGGSSPGFWSLLFFFGAGAVLRTTGSGHGVARPPPACVR